VRARRAGIADVDEICRICSEGWRETYRELLDPEEIERVVAEFYAPDRVRGELAETAGWDGWWVAVDDDERIVAAGGGGLIAPGSGEVFVLYADPARLGEGGGTAVLTALTDQHRARGATEQWVSVEPGNELGLRFYRSRGFVEKGTRPAYRRAGFSLRLWREI
jgi:ribosomal protein S18 acetylase RimI-like enzyme